MDTKQVVNLTPHEIVVRVGGEEIVFPPSGNVVRVKVFPMRSTTDLHPEDCDCVIPVFRNAFGEVEGLPPEDQYKDVVYIVSSLVAQAAAHHERRYDLLAPDTGPTAIRNSDGQIVAVTQLQQF